METPLSDRTLFSSELLNENKDVGPILILGLVKIPKRKERDYQVNKPGILAYSYRSF